MNIDVFNGDADGICALLQLRLAQPVDSILITGVKRDIGLLRRTPARAGDIVTVLDLSMDVNLRALTSLLNEGVSFLYIDHHFSGEIPAHPGLTALIDTDADICTSLLMNRHLGGVFTEWAIVGAFGDNLDAAAERVAKSINLPAQKLLDFKQLGVCINYNAYGSDIGDLYFSPDMLYRHLVGFDSPSDFITEKADVYRQLLGGYRNDMNMARQLEAEFQTDRIAVFILPDEKWARRVSGVLGNELANSHQDRAHAILTSNPLGGYRVSVRAPINNKNGADDLCRLFSGGGRKAAAGIDWLPYEQITEFIAAFQAKY